MKYDNYTIEQIDQYNWTLIKTKPDTYRKAIKHHKTGEVLHKKGETYDRLYDLGYYGDYFKALQALVRDKAPEGANDIEEVLANLKCIEHDIKNLKP
jgi:predicted fused transcriptional regulator/phosphomethylpyrimidine kinase